MRKRANGEGSVFRLSDGSWRAACPGGSPSFRGATRAEAMRRRDQYLAGHRKTSRLPKRARDSFAALLLRWISSRQDSLRPRTVESYQSTIDAYIVPAIGGVPAGKLTPDDIRSAMARAKSPRTKNYVRSVCHLALEFAVDNDILQKNVARKVSPVSVPHTEREMPSPEQFEALLGAIDAEHVSTRALLLVLAFTGLRIGEALGLRWPDYQDGYLRIRRAADRSGDLVAVKTKAGQRLVPVSKLAAAAIEEWRSAQDDMRRRHAGRWKDAPIPDLVFTTKFGTRITHRNVSRSAHRVTEKAGIGKRGVHYLRHMAISYLIADPEMDIKTVQVLAGHSSIRVTLDTYGHLIPGRMQKAAEAMDRRSK